MRLKENLKCLIVCFFVIFISIKAKTTEKTYDDNLKLNDVSKQCEMSLEWYTDNPGLKGEFLRVLEYCHKYAKD